MKDFLKRLASLLPHESEDTETRYFKIIIYSLVGLVVLMGIVGFSTFYISLRGGEQTLVPEVAGSELEDALLSLQERGLIPRVQLRYTSDPTLKGSVVSLTPAPGTLVKAGRAVQLVVSQGAVVDRVEDFEGQTLTEVRRRLQAMFTTFDALLQIDDIVYVYDQASPGTILNQTPDPGTELAGLTNLDLVVSRGPQTVTQTLASYVGLAFGQAIDSLAAQNIPFTFDSTAPGGVTAPLRIAAQDPEAGTDIEPGTSVNLTVVRPDQLEEGQVFGLFERTLPTYPVPVELSVTVQGPDEEVSTLFRTNHPGGELSFPYLVEGGSVIVISVFDEEEIRFEVIARNQ